MLTSRLKAASQQRVVEFLSGTNLTNQTSDATRSLTLNTGFVSGHVLVAMIGNRTGTPPSLLSGYTDILSQTASGGGFFRSWRVQYKTASGTSETISWTGAYGYLLAFKNINNIGQFSSINTAIAATISLPDLSGLDTSGSGFILAGSYVTGIYTAATSPYQDWTYGAYVDLNTNSSLTSKTISTSGTIFGSYAIELLP